MQSSSRIDTTSSATTHFRTTSHAQTSSRRAGLRVHGTPTGRLLPVLLLLAVSFLLASCAATPQPEQTLPFPAVPGLTLPQLLEQTRNEQYPPLIGLTEKPPASALGAFLSRLAWEPAELLLADDVTTFVADDRFLAVGRDDGSISVLGPNPAVELALPPEKGSEDGSSDKHVVAVDLLAWTPGAPRLLAAGPDRKRIRVFNLARARMVAELAVGHRIAFAAVSPDGRRVALLDEDGRLWRGPAKGPMRLVGELHAAPLGVAYGPDGGELTAVGKTGTVLQLRSNKRDAEPERFTIPGRPFISAAFQSTRVELTRTDGQSVAYDLATRKPVEFHRHQSAYRVQHGVLRYRTWKNLPVLLIRPGKPQWSARVSRRLGLVAIDDLDGRTRTYSLASGELVRAPKAQKKGTQWQNAPLGPDGEFCIGDACCKLADTVIQLDHARLHCRYLPSGFYLWWTHDPRPHTFGHAPRHLPIRRTIRADEVVAWVPLDAPPDLP